MIAKDQPTIFPNNVVAATSSVKNGSIRAIKDASMEEQTQGKINRQAFLSELGISDEQTALVWMQYNRDDYCRYAVVGQEDAGSGLVRPTEIQDALMTNVPNIALYLPLADCCGLIAYNPSSHSILVSHLGRHNLEQDGAVKSICFFAETYKSSIDDMLVYLSPCAGKTNYPLFRCEGRSIKEEIYRQLDAIGLPRNNIESADTDTTASRDYFSHSEFLKGRRESDGRFAVVAMLK